MKHVSNHLLCILTILGLSISCKEEVPPIQEDPDDSNAQFTLIDNTIECEAEGGDFSLAYTLEGGLDRNIVFESTEPWINSFSAEEGQLRLHIDQTDISKSRVISVKAGYKVADKMIIVNQAGYTDAQVAKMLHFDFELEHDGPTVVVKVTPNLNDVLYYYEVQRKSVVDQYLAAGLYDNAEDVLANIANQMILEQLKYGAFYGQSASDVINSITSKGVSTEKIELVADTDYYVFAWGLKLSGEMVGKPSIESFHSQRVKESSNEIELSINEINSDRIKWSVKTSNNDPYIVKVMACSKVDGKTDQEIASAFYEEYKTNYSNFLHSGNADGSNISLTEDSDYYLTAFGFDYGTATTKVFKEKFHTLVSASSEGMTWNYEIHKLTNYRAILSISGEPMTALYVADVTDAANTDAQILKTVNDDVDFYVKTGYANNRTEWLRRIGTRGEEYTEKTNLQPDHEYKLYAIPVNESDGSLGPVTILKTFRTPKAEASTCSIDLTWDKYFDGTTVYNRFKNSADWAAVFESAVGSAIVPVEIQKNGDVLDYYYDIYTGDLTEEPDGVNIPTDHQLIIDLQINGIVNMPKMNIFCAYDTILTVVTVARDTNDNYGKVYRRKILIEKDGASPVTEFDINKYISQ